VGKAQTTPEDESLGFMTSARDALGYFNHLREFFCPGCKTLLEVDAAPPGYPISHDFLPDLEGFYREWLGASCPSSHPA
jgi:acetone carboxylase gamma subunit